MEYLVHFPLDYSVFNKFGYVKWRTTIFFLILKIIDHGQERYNDLMSLSIR
jgi:hypothetical protein